MFYFFNSDHKLIFKDEEGLGRVLGRPWWILLEIGGCVGFCKGLLGSVFFWELKGRFWVREVEGFGFFW